MRLPKDSPWIWFRRWTWCLWISLPIFYLYLIVWGKNGFAEVAVFLVFAPCFVSMIAVQYFKCPRCKKRFFKNDAWRLGAKSCVHCGLPKWEEEDFVGAIFETAPDPTPPIAEMSSDTSANRNLNFLTLVLRDDPGAIHLPVDPAGWADVTHLLTRANRYGFKLDREELVEVVEGEGKSRFELDESVSRIRFRH